MMRYASDEELEEFELALEEELPELMPEEVEEIFEEE